MFTGDFVKPWHTVAKGAQTLDILDKDFKSIILDMFKELKETVLKE